MKTLNLKTLDPATVSYLLSRASACFGVLAAVGIFMYGTFLLMTVMHAASRQTAQVQLRSISAQVGQMEAQYLAKTQSITPDMAVALGYIKPEAITTVYEVQTQTAVALNTQH